MLDEKTHMIVLERLKRREKMSGVKIFGVEIKDLSEPNGETQDQEKEPLKRLSLLTKVLALSK